MDGSVWAEIKKIIGDCLKVLSQDRGIIEIGDFTYGMAIGPFGYKFVAGESGMEEVHSVDTFFKIDDECNIGALFAVGFMNDRRTCFISENTLYDEPPAYDRNFPDFSFGWGKIIKDGAVVGRLKFLRIDFSYDDFVNYEGENLEVSFKGGNPDLYCALPASFKNLDSFLGTAIINEIDFERAAEELLSRFKLREFAKACCAKTA